MTALLKPVHFPQHKLPDRFCPACGADGLRAFYAVDGVPTAPDCLAATADEAAAAPASDVRLALCETCGFVTNAAFDPAVPPRRATVPQAVRDTDLFVARQWAERYSLSGKTVIEIGCGDGTFLEAFCRLAGARGIGFDPAIGRERSATADVLFVAGEFADYAADVRADFIFCRQRLSQIATPLDELTRLRGALAETPVAFEVPDFSPVLANGRFWDVGYPQASYFTIGALTRVFQRAGFEPTRTLVDDGRHSLVIEAEPTGGQKRDMPTLSELRLVSQFVRVCTTRLHEWSTFLSDASRDGKRYVIWGGGARAVQFVTTLGVAGAAVGVVDPDPSWHGLFLPGTRLRIDPPTVLSQTRPDCVIATHGSDLSEIASTLQSANLTPTVLCLDGGVTPVAIY